jgi:hypothetical protein
MLSLLTECWLDAAEQVVPVHYMLNCSNSAISKLPITDDVSHLHVKAVVEDGAAVGAVARAVVKVVVQMVVAEQPATTSR